MNKGNEYRVGVGASSILMVFIVLCLTTLGVLSFASARADFALTERRQRQVEAYYAATAQAQALIAQIDAALLEAAQSPDTYDDSLQALTSLQDTLKVKARNNSITFSLPVGENQRLDVELTANGPDAAERYTLTKHQLINTEDWEPDFSITLPSELDEGLNIQ